MKIQVSVLASLLAAWLSSVANANTDTTLLDAIGEPRTGQDVVCADIMPLERGKFRKCRVRWIAIELEEFATELERLRAERIEQQRNAVWDWLNATPVEDCDAVPEIEIAKFPFCATTNDAAGLTLLARHENGLSQLRTLRGQLASQLADLRTRLDRINELEKAQSGSFDEPPAEELEPLLARLRDLDAQTRLMEMLSTAQLAAAELQQQVVALRMMQAPDAADLRDGASETASVVASIRAGERLVWIETDSPQSEFIPVVHGLSGFGFVARADLEK